MAATPPGEHERYARWQRRALGAPMLSTSNMLFAALAAVALAFLLWRLAHRGPFDRYFAVVFVVFARSAPSAWLLWRDAIRRRAA